jgi:hypothetical protein
VRVANTLITGKVYDATAFVPPYIEPFLSVPVYAICEGFVVVCGFNHFACKWVELVSGNYDEVSPTSWWGL